MSRGILERQEEISCSKHLNLSLHDNAIAFFTLDDALKTSPPRVFARDKIPDDLVMDWYIRADSE